MTYYFYGVYNFEYSMSWRINCLYTFGFIYWWLEDLRGGNSLSVYDMGSLLYINVLNSDKFHAVNGFCCAKS